MSTSPVDQPVDHVTRDRALDTAESFIVRAPAGSGKTELLTARYLALLAQVEQPEQILAITFTRKAAAEMRKRVLDSILEAQQGGQSRRALYAKAAAKRNGELGWEVETNPSRLRIMTIDGFNAFLVAKMPWLTRFGRPPRIEQNAEELYLAAASEVLAHIEHNDEYAGFVAAVLGHYDNKAASLKKTLVRLLSQRDQWLRHSHTVEKPDEIRPNLEAALRGMIEATLQVARGLLLPHEAELVALAGYAGSNLEDEHPLNFERLAALPRPEADNIELWKGLSWLLLKADGKPRKMVNKSQGFPAGKGEAKEWKERFAQFMERISEEGNLVAALGEISKLPPARYSEEEWRIITPLVKVARLAIYYLRKSIAESGQCDFAEVSDRALRALGQVGEPSELLLALDRKVEHILVDEFQDTSNQQFNLLETLVEGWTPGDGRTIFLVGDPMQSIYRFREAQVGLFKLTEDCGIGLVRPRSLTLKVNFRSSPLLVEWYNRELSAIFPETDEIKSGAVTYVECIAGVEAGEDPGEGEQVRFFPVVGKDHAGEAREVVEAARKWGEQGDVAVLARGRPHLKLIVAEFNRRGIPFKGEELYSLSNRETVNDLRTLYKALCDPSDRLAWLALLRAPWCGLTLCDLMQLVGGDARPVPTILDEDVSGRVPAPVATRIARVWRIMKEGLGRIRREAARITLEATWTALGAPAWLEGDALSDAKAYFELLSSLEGGGMIPRPERVDRALGSLYSQPVPGDEIPITLMTIHKAKGLEFDTVLLPGTGRKPGGGDKRLFDWDEDETGGLIIGPPPGPGMKGSPVQEFLRHLEKRKERNELCRLLYVATTRAKKRLFIWGHADMGRDGEFKADSRSMLGLLWKVVGDRFDGLEAMEQVEEDAEIRQLKISRHPDGWLPGELEAPKLVMPEEIEDSPVEEIEFNWAQSQRKHIGNLAHQLIEAVGNEGLDRWSRARVEGMGPMIHAKLSGLGVGAESIEAAAVDVVEAVCAVIEEEKGRWIMSAATDAASEYSLTGQVGKRFGKGVVDRTFIDDSGTRWIIDFKATSHEGGGLEEFVRGQVERHRAQLKRYTALFRLLEPKRKVKAALYFPLMRRFEEVDV